MDEAKRKELEDLKKQIDPNVLERVAQTMGGGGGGAAPASSSSPAASHSGSRGGLGELKSRIARREKELNDLDPSDQNVEEDAQSIMADKAFVVFDVDMTRGRQILSYIQKMELTHTSVTSDPKRFLAVVLNMVNNAAIEYPSVVVNSESYPLVNALLSSGEISQMKKALPKLDNMAVFVVYENDSELRQLKEVDPRYVLNWKLGVELNKKRVLQVLEQLHKPS